VVCTQPVAAGGGLAGTPASPPHKRADVGRELAMTVYVLRYAATGELTTDRTAAVAVSARCGSTGPPLLTHVWQIVFEWQARGSDRR
jgi:hypothetical protein